MEDKYLKLARRAEEIQNVADEISSRFINLASFKDAAFWKTDALALIRLLEQLHTGFTDYRTDQEDALKQAETARSAQSFLKRTFASRGDEKQYGENVEGANRTIRSIETAISGLHDLIERTPTSKDEQKAMLQDLRQLNKELTVEKRSTNESMRQIRTEARQKTASWAGVRGKGVVGSVARYDRAQTTRNKESALQPHEEIRTTIERHLIEVEKRINWTSRFSGDESMQQTAVLRCAYCGRRVEPNMVCLGCGSDRTMVET